MAVKAAPLKRARKTWHGNTKLESLLVPLHALKTDPTNARAHGDRNIEAITGSLREFGQQKPIVTRRDGTVLAGNGMLEAARGLNWTHLAAVPTDLDGKLATGFALADNRTAELAEWDLKALAAALHGLEGTDLIGKLGWSTFELEPILAATWGKPAVEGGLEYGEHPHTVSFTAEQFDIVSRACDKLRAAEPGGDVPMARCLELICADYLA